MTCMGLLTDEQKVNIRKTSDRLSCHPTFSYFSSTFLLFLFFITNYLVFPLFLIKSYFFLDSLGNQYVIALVIRSIGLVIFPICVPDNKISGREEVHFPSIKFSISRIIINELMKTLKMLFPTI
jgi:uncharacterized membrane protein